MAYKDLTGQKFNKLTVIKRYGQDKHKNYLWLCKCECGSEKDVIVRSKDLKAGNTKSCGCLILDTNKKKREMNIKHCMVEGCTEKFYAKDYCRKHYEEFKLYGHIRTEEEKKNMRRVAYEISAEKRKEYTKCDYCDEDGFYNKEFQMNLCGKHYAQMKTHGLIQDRTMRDKNEIVLYKNYAEIVLYDGKTQIENGRVLISLDKLELCKKFKWHLNKEGYAETSSTRKRHERLHRLIMNPPDDVFVDHINGDRLDCRNENLRLCTQQQNNWNMGQKENKSGARGVEKRTDKCFIPYINVSRKKIHLGCVKTLEEAKKIRQLAEVKYFGEFAPNTSRKEV